MRYPRNAKIFRGHLDVAPLAGVFFLLVMFLVLGCLMYTPGVALQLPGTAPETREENVVIDERGRFFIGRRTYSEDVFGEWLKQKVREAATPLLVVARPHASAPRAAVLRLRDLARQANAGFSISGMQIELPVADRFSGTTNAAIRVAINLGGQFFLDNRLVSPAELKRSLTASVAQAGEPLSLIVFADKSTELDALLRLAAVAREAGIREVIQAVQPRATGSGRNSGRL